MVAPLLRDGVPVITSGVTRTMTAESYRTPRLWIPKDLGGSWRCVLEG